MAKGFTLLEVLIAITIITLAFVSLFSTITQTISNHDYLIHKTYSSWIADNVLNQYYLENSSAPVLEGKQSMGGRDYEWVIIPAKTEQAEVNKISVRIFHEDQLMIEMVGYENNSQKG